MLIFTFAQVAGPHAAGTMATIGVQGKMSVYVSSQWFQHLSKHVFDRKAMWQCVKTLYP
jgi:hypothetical protein